MTHPGDHRLGLYAGCELSLWDRFRIRRHLAGCARCRREAEAFRGARESLLAAAAETPTELNWARLAGEMRANIRVGLAAGECVGPSVAGSTRSGWRTAIALVPVTLVVLAGVWLQRSQPVVPSAPPADGMVLEATSQGIQLRQGGGVLAVQHPDARDVTCTVSAQGTLRARYVDSETGYVTISHVYAE